MSRMIRVFRHITFRSAVLFVAGAALYTLLFQMLYTLLAFDALWPYDSAGSFAASFIRNFIPILLLSTVNVLIVFEMPLPRMLETRIFIKGLLDIAVSIGVLWGINLLYVRLWRLAGVESTVVAPGTLLSDVLLLLIIETAYYICLSRRLAAASAALRKQALEYQYEALSAQINPHFLFNSLNILHSLIDIDKEKSRTFTLQLADVYRRVLAFRGRQEVTLGEELQLIRAYVSVLETRYFNQFSVEITEECPRAMRRKVIPFTLQLLLENVTKHNVISSRYPMRVRLRIGENGVEVTNPVRPRACDPSVSGLGLNYIRTQYERHGLALDVTSGDGLFTAVVPYINNRHTE